MSWGERVSRHRPWIFFLVFCCSSSMLVRWFCLHRFSSGVTLLFGAYSKMGASIFVCLYISLSRLQLESSRQAAPSNPSRRLTSAWCQREDISVSGGSIPVQIFFLVILNCRSHSLVTGSSTTSAQPKSPRGQPAAPAESAFSYFFFFLSVPRNKPLVLFITWTYHITLHE